MLSFIVPAYNEERLLEGTLAALHRAGRALDESYEVVVADDGSTDRTALHAQAHGAVVVTVAHRQIAATSIPARALRAAISSCSSMRTRS